MNTEPTNTRISVIIPTYKRGNIFYQCIASVIDSISDQDEIIVVNDDKNAKISIDLMDLKGKKVTVLDNPKQGVASARNYGAAKAKGVVLLFIDDDMIVNSEAIETSYGFVKNHELCAVNVNWIYPPEVSKDMQNSSFGRYLLSIGYTNLKGWMFDNNWKDNTFFVAQGIASAFLMIHRVDFENIKGYDESFPFAGFEDHDFSSRLLGSGIKAYVNTVALIYHNEIDRVDLREFLNRKERGALTRRNAVERGYGELKLHYNIMKQYTYGILLRTEACTFALIKAIPNCKIFDSFYRLGVNRLIGLRIYKGYNNRNNK